MKFASLFATLALTPALLHAQPVAANTAAPDTTSPAGLRVSTGVVPARLIHKVDVTSEMDWQWEAAGPLRHAEVSLTVDTTGHATNVKIIKSAGADLDSSILASVSQYRFQPARVDDQPTPVDMDLNLDIIHR